MNFEKLKKYVEKGGEINKKGKNDVSILHVACEYGDFQSVKYIVDNGADINAIDDYLMTPICRAASGDFGSKIGLLSNEHAKIIDYLISKGSQSSHEQLNAEAEYMLLPKNSNSIDHTFNKEYGNALLFIAARAGNFKMVKAVIKCFYTINFDKTYQGGLTAMDVAQKNGHNEIFKFIKKRLEWL